MTILSLNDRARHPPEWTAWLSETQYAVFLSDVETRVQLDLSGGPVTGNAALVCYVFDSLPDAEAFGRQKVDEFPRMLCEIYDGRGKAIDPIRSFTHPRLAHHLPNRRSARLKILIAWLLIAVSPALFWIDYQHEGVLIYPTLVGFTCIVTGGRLLWWGYSELAIVGRREGEE